MVPQCGPGLFRVHTGEETGLQGSQEFSQLWHQSGGTNLHCQNSSLSLNGVWKPTTSLSLGEQLYVHEKLT